MKRLLLATAAAVLACAAGAADKPKTGGFGTAAGKGATGPMLNREQLRACMALHERRQAAATENRKAREDVDREKAELQREGDALKEALAALDRSSQEAVDQYNARAGERDKRIDAFEARVNAFNAKLEEANALGAKFSADCENRRFDENDELAIRKGK